MNNFIITEDEILSLGYLKDLAGRFYHETNGAINIAQDSDGGYLIYVIGAEVSKAYSVSYLRERTEKYLIEFAHLKK